MANYFDKTVSRKIEDMKDETGETLITWRNLMLPKVAIVCASYNYGRFIVEGMKSIQRQTYKVR